MRVTNVKFLISVNQNKFIPASSWLSSFALAKESMGAINK